MNGPTGLGETFTNLDLAMFPDVGHFPHREDPDRAAAEIAAFFQRASAGAEEHRGGTARRDKTLAAPCRSLKFWPGSAASPASGSDQMTVAIADGKRQRESGS